MDKHSNFACFLQPLFKIKVILFPALYPSFPGGDVLSWGLNSHGQLGLGKEVTLQYTPALVWALTGVAVTQISAGATHTLFLTLPGLVYCCGANQSGQLGLNRLDKKGTYNLFKLTETVAAILTRMPPAGSNCYSSNYL